MGGKHGRSSGYVHLGWVRGVQERVLGLSSYRNRAYVFPPWAIDGLDGFIKGMGVVGVHMLLASFLCPLVILHGPEGALAFNLDGVKTSLQLGGLGVGLSMVSVITSQC